MQSRTLKSEHHHTVNFLSLLPVKFLDFSEQILHTLVGCAFLPVGGVLSAMCLSKSLLLDSTCETPIWARVAPFSANPPPPFCRKNFHCSASKSCYWTATKFLQCLQTFIHKRTLCFILSY